MSLRRGTLYWAHMDKRRPVLVLSPDVRNELASNVIVVPITSRVRDSMTHVLLRVGEGGVLVPSSLLCEQVTTLEKGAIEPAALGKLAPARLAAVERAVMRAIGAAVTEPD